MKVLTSILILIISPTQSDFQSDLKACLIEVFEKYFRIPNMLIYDATVHAPPEKVQRNLLPDLDDIVFSDIVRFSASKYPRAVTVHDYNYNPIEKDRNENYQFHSESAVFLVTEDQVNEWAPISSIFKHVKQTEKWKKQGRTLILVRNEDITKDMSVMAKNALAGNWKWNKAVNVVVMIARDEEFYFFNYKPYRQPDCRMIRNRPVKNVWKNGKFQKKINLFPPKIFNDLQGCSLRIVNASCVPYTYSGSGFEERLINELENHFNFSREAVLVPKGQDFWTTLSENGTPSGSIGLLNDQVADLAYGCLMMNAERYSLAESLPCFYQDSLTWFVPYPSKKSHFANIFDAFSITFWLIIAGTTVLSTIVFLLLVKLEEFVLTAPNPSSLVGVSIRVFAMALSSPIAVPSRQFLLRFFTILFSIYSLHITAIYQSSLFRLYKTNEYTNVYESIEQAVDNKLLIWLRTSTQDMYNQSDHRLWNKILQPDRHTYLHSDISTAFDQIAKNKTAAVMFIKSTMQVYIQTYYMDETGRRPEIIPIAEKFTSYPVGIYLSPGNPLFDLFKDTIYNILSGGLVDFWLKDELQLREDDKLVKTATNVSLKLEHIAGALILLGLLISGCAIVFIIEVIVWLANGKQVNIPIRREELRLRRRLFLANVVSYQSQSNRQRKSLKK